MKAIHRMTEQELVGQTVKITADLQNGLGIIKAGSQGTITKKFKGLSITMDECKCCGYRPSISQVDYRYVMLITNN